MKLRISATRKFELVVEFGYFKYRDFSVKIFQQKSCTDWYRKYRYLKHANSTTRGQNMKAMNLS